MTDVLALGIAELTTGFATLRYDPVVVAEAYFAEIAAKDDGLRSYITVASKTARTEAEASRKRWLEHRSRGPLDGIPIGVKDNIDVAGLPCTGGTAAFRSRVPQWDAPVITVLRQQGAVILGKLNMHEGAFGATTDNEVYGRCMNPLKLGYTPGGSSGGSGAAVAAHLCVAALGTDTMGSVRLPAAYCGVYGFKPSNSAISIEGVIPLSHAFDSIGVLALTAPDLVIVAEALLRRPTTPKMTRSVQTLAGLRVGVPQQMAAVELSPAVAFAFDRFVERLNEAGASIVPVDVPSWNPDKARRAGLLITELEGAEFYVRELGRELSGISPGFAAMLRYGMQVSPARAAAAYEVVENVRRDCVAVFGEVDIIALPTAPQMSFSHDGPTPTNQADFTALANFACAPAISLPFALDPLPIGMQLVAAPDRDIALLDIALAAAELCETSVAQVPRS